MKLFIGAKAFIEREGKILIVREADTYIEGTELGKWDVPGGRIEPRETLMDGLVREVGEECGLRIADSKVFAVREGFPVIKGEECHIVRIYFTAQAGEGEVRLSQDHDAWEWIDPQDHERYPLMDDLHQLCEEYRRL
jgi:8-oxo-dGTP diphosphatase